MKLTLLPHHREHLERLGMTMISAVPYELELTETEYKKHYADWKRSMPDGGHEEWHKRAIANAAWLRYVRGTEAAKVPAPVVIAHHVPKWERYVVMALLLAIALLLFKGKAHSDVLPLLPMNNSGHSVLANPEAAADFSLSQSIRGPR
jgi:hypothetical protein